jgi:hypothetical protein
MIFEKKHKSYIVRVLLSAGMLVFYAVFGFYLFFLLVLNVRNNEGDIILIMWFGISTFFAFIEHVYYTGYIEITSDKLIIKGWRFDKIITNKEYDLSKVKVIIDGNPLGFISSRMTIRYENRKIFSQLEKSGWTSDEFKAIKKEVERISPPKYIKY